MPTLKRYQNKSGFYILANINNAVVTFQTSQAAHNIFKYLNHGHNSTISWRLLSELKKSGHVYTHGTGAGDISSNYQSKLTSKEELALDRHLSSNVDNKQRERLYDSLDQFQWSQRAFSKKDFVSRYNTILQKYHEKSISAFSNAPLVIDNLRIHSKTVEYSFQLENISVLCKDVRWDNNRDRDFNGEVRYDGPDLDAEFAIREGYILEWENGESTSAGLQTEAEAHDAALDLESDSKGGLGFNSSSWVSVIRRLFIFVKNYDILPHTRRSRGHRGLCTSAELIGADIWVTVNSKTSSKKRGVPFANDEMVKIIVRNSQPGIPMLVRVGGDVSRGKLWGNTVELETGS